VVAIRTLKPGETVPPFPPKRYASSQGYIRLRWRVSKNEHVEAYEHRVFDGRITLADEVHHIDHDKTNNDPTNLRQTTTKGHGRYHQTLDRSRMVELYQQGYSTPQIGEQMGCNATTVYRALVAEGIQPRSISESLRYSLDKDLIVRLHKAGVRSRRIANALGFSAAVVDKAIERWHLTPHRPGRPTNGEVAAARTALRDEGLK
jgi:Homeodomain-like domain/HNH endonuclease